MSPYATKIPSYDTGKGMVGGIFMLYIRTYVTVLTFVPLLHSTYVLEFLYSTATNYPLQTYTVSPGVELPMNVHVLKVELY